VDIDLTVQRVAASAGSDQKQVVQGMLQSAADVALGDWFEFTIGPPVMDSTAAPYGGARYPVEARMDGPSLPDSIWTPGSVMWLCDRWRQSCAGTGWDSRASNCQRSG